MTDVAQRLAALREQMARAGYDAFLVPRADEYLGEYLPEHNERLRWLTGFTGSAGMAVVLVQSAALFVDGRYTVQVRSQVAEDHFSHHHLVDEPPLDWLVAQLDSRARVACDPRLHSQRWYRHAQNALGDAGIELVADSDNLVDRAWRDRPTPVVRTALLLDERFTGESSQAKRRRIGADIARRGCDAALVFAPDAVSWLLNVRGRDLPQLPVLMGSALLDKGGDMTLLVDPARLPAGFADHAGPGITVLPETDIARAFATQAGRRVLADEDGASAFAHRVLEEAGATVVAGDDPVLLPKACKNAVELAGARAAHLRDAVAEVRFLAWLDREVAAGRLHDEAALAAAIEALRSEGEHFHACSFDTISAAGPNAALCHYNHRNGTPAVLVMDSVYLVDSGGQYSDGTTDITRTVAIGDPGVDVRRLFTLVLKGHIALARARFPRGTTGSQLDALARQYLWAEGFDYDHGTGHGVGAFLSVHEGPQRISKQHGNAALRPGMIISNEPGYYRDGAFGIRCENLLAVRDCEEGRGDKATLAFETLTLVPFDQRLLAPDLLDNTEREWLDAYHVRVREALDPLLDAPDRQWLAHATAPIA